MHRCKMEREHWLRKGIVLGRDKYASSQRSGYANCYMGGLLCLDSVVRSTIKSTPTVEDYTLPPPTAIVSWWGD